MQERSHAFAMESQLWPLDPRPNLSSIVWMVEHGFALPEASSTPVMLEVRIRACHVQGSLTPRNRPPPFSLTRRAVHRAGTLAALSCRRPASGTSGTGSRAGDPWRWTTSRRMN
jgi:TPP-dependent indolepyruvate ferredoxin oxidoreductase alpha subunit